MFLGTKVYLGDLTKNRIVVKNVLSNVLMNFKYTNRVINKNEN